MANFCSNCGTALDPTQKFCSECGTAAVSVTSSKTKNEDPMQIHELVEYIKKSPSVVFLSNPEDSFHSDTYPYMYTYSLDAVYGSLDEFAEENELETDEIQCDNCKSPFLDMNNFSLDDGNHVFGHFCPKCIMKTLRGRQIFDTQISALDYANWTRLTLRPPAIVDLNHKWRGALPVDGGSDEQVKCWSCADGLVDLAMSHWNALIFYTNIPKPVCDTCITKAQILIPSDNGYTKIT